MKTMREVEEMKIVKGANKPRKRELEEELKLKRIQLEEDEVRMNGGFSPTLKKEVMAIDKELIDLANHIEVKTIEKEEFYPVNADWGFQKNPIWLEFNKKKIQEIIDQMELTQRKILDQKNKIELEIPELRARIKELETLLFSFLS